LLDVALQCMLVLIATRVLGRAIKKLRQPKVIGEILGGIVLGPSVLGRIDGWTDTFFPPSTLSHFALVANVGLIFFMFFMGLELDPALMRRQLKLGAPIALAAIVTPFCMGVASSFWLYDVNDRFEAGKTAFVLFFGAAMSFTAFPVLASVLQANNLLSDPLGMLAFSCAAIDDVLAWCVLAFASSFAISNKPLNGLYTTLISVLYVCVMVFVVRPLLRKLDLAVVRSRRAILERRAHASGSGAHAAVGDAAAGDVERKESDAVPPPHVAAPHVAAPHVAAPHVAAASSHAEVPLSRTQVTFIFLVLVLSAYITESIGIHAFFGAFLAGIIVPKDTSTFAHQLAPRIEVVVLDFLLPLYFANAGLRMDIQSLRTSKDGGVLVFVIVLACAAKFVPTTLMSRLLTGKSWRFCVSLGVLMNTRGLVELIVLNIGLDSGILSIRLYTMMVIMAVLTTALTPPLLHVLYVRHLDGTRHAHGGGRSDLADKKSGGAERETASHHSAEELADELTLNDNGFGGEYTAAMRAATHEVLQAPPVEVDVPHGTIAVLRRLSGRDVGRGDAAPHLLPPPSIETESALGDRIDDVPV
jgi:Kef-type K+ transport system membrane component KefB